MNYFYVICMSLVCTHMSSVSHSYVLGFMVKPQTSDIRMAYKYIRVTYRWNTSTYRWHPYVTHKCLYVMHMSLVCTFMSSVCHPYVLVCHPYVTRVYYSYVICMPLVCTHMSSICTCMCLYVMRISLLCTCVSSVCHHVYLYGMSPLCHSYVLVCHPYGTRIHFYVICMSLLWGFTMNFWRSWWKSFNFT